MAGLLFKKLKRVLLGGPSVALALWLQGRERHLHLAWIIDTSLGSCGIKKYIYSDLDFSKLLRDGRAVCDVPYQTAFLQTKNVSKLLN